VIIVFANDHLVNSRIRSYPDFLIGMADEHRGPHEWFKPWIGCRDYAIKGDRHVAAALFRGMIRRGIRMFAETGALKFDDNISVPVTMGDLDGLGIPLVPVLQNCIVPPIPEQHRCYEVGQALADIIPEIPLYQQLTVNAFNNKLGGYTETPDEYQEVVDRLLKKHKASAKFVPEPVIPV